jgi:hypothetical protein
MDGLFCRTGETPAPGDPRVKMSQQCARAHLISIHAHDPSAELCKEGMNCLKTVGLLQNGWTLLPDWGATRPRQPTCQNESEKCARAHLIPIRARDPSAEPCKEGMDCLKTGGLL